MTLISHILCPVDFSEQSAHAVRHALAMAKWYEAKVTLLHVWVNQTSIELPPIVLGDAERRELLDEMRRLAGDHHGLPLDILVREAPDVHQEILNQISELGADLLVLGNHGRTGLGRLLLGSVTEKLLRTAKCPVMVVPPAATQEALNFRHLICPVDFSDSSLTAATAAMSLAQETDATLTLLHVIDIPPEFDEQMPFTDLNLGDIRAAAVAAAQSRLRDLVPDSVRTFCTVETSVVEGSVYRQILAIAADRHSDLIVMGVHGRGALDLLVFGSNTARVTRGATCPVLVIPSGH